MHVVNVMNHSAIFQWLASMVPGTRASYTVRGGKLQQAVRKFLRVALWRIPGLLANPAGHARLLRILQSKEVMYVTQHHPKLVYKYLSGNYLARHLSIGRRLIMQTHHYEFTRTRMHAGFLRNVFADRPLIWQDASKDHRFRITLSFPFSPHHVNRVADHEGDLSLIFAMDDLPLYTLCFSVVPGRVVSVDRQDVLFLGRLQGADGRFEHIRQATRVLHDISPKDILLAALQGVANALGIDVIVGVSNAEQLSKSRGPRVEHVVFDYDSFWAALHAQRTVDNLFVLSLPMPEKPIETIAQKHRGRTLRKRRYKDSVSTAVCEEFRSQHLAGPGDAHRTREKASTAAGENCFPM